MRTEPPAVGGAGQGGTRAPHGVRSDGDFTARRKGDVTWVYGSDTRVGRNCRLFQAAILEPELKSD